MVSGAAPPLHATRGLAFDAAQRIKDRMTSLQKNPAQLALYRVFLWV
jgi:hypothetical protein